jgi:hypothetical protein
MQITGVSESQFRFIVDKVSRAKYEGNVIIRELADLHGVRRPRIRVSLRTVTGKGSDRDSCAPGSRRSASIYSERRMPVACWHVFRDVFAELFEQHPTAIVRTAFATYNGRDGFESNYRATGNRNIGSAMYPRTMPELCDC